MRFYVVEMVSTHWFRWG